MAVKEGKIMKAELKVRLNKIFTEHIKEGNDAVNRHDLNKTNYELGYAQAVMDIMNIIWMVEIL